MSGVRVPHCPPMCGIFGYIGEKNNAPQIVFNGLIDIEYRGYDSWGVSSWDGAKFNVVKKIGFLPKAYTFPASNLSLGHTRWATHGGVTKENAHPHSSCDDKLVLIHNGIVENYLELKKELKNHKLKSETDSEVIIHLIEQEKGSLKEAVSKVFNK